ncbi:hypothetical protein TWF506_000071 [Arthrobotrys conoides]|uniref:Uncharacterized protein n=1 Tax=Arthrobotrys conoides TaxID=74498 RepID=A0AAN8NF42_9PEZI
MSRRPPPQDHSASSNDVPTVTSPVNSSYPAGILRPPPANRAISEPFGGYDVPASSTTPNARPLRSILTNPIPPPSTPRVRFLIPQSSTEIRDRLAGREGLVDSPGSTASTTSRDGAYSDSDPEQDDQQQQQATQPRRPSSQEPRDLSDIIGRSVRGFVKRNFDRNTRGQDQERERERDPNRGSVSRGVDEQPYRTRNNGSPAQSDTSSVITSPELRRASLANTTGRNSPLQRFGARSINELRNVPSRASTVDSITSEPKPSKPEDLSKAPPPLLQSQSQASQSQQRPLAESGRPRPGSPIRRKSSGHDSYHGPGQADTYFYGTPAAEQEPGVYYGPPPPKMPTPPPPPAMVPPKYKPGGGSAAEFYNPDNVDPDAAIPIQEGSQYELTITTGAAKPQAPQPSPGSFFGGPITAEPTSSLPGGFPGTPVNASAPTSFSTAQSNPSYPPQAQVQLSYAPPTNPGAPSTSVNTVGGATMTTGTMSAIDAATLAEMAYDQSLANQQHPTSTATPSNLANLPPLPPSTAPTYASPYAPPLQAINTNVQAIAPPRPLTTMSPVPMQSPVLVAPRPQHPSNMVPAIAAAAVAGGVIGAAAHASHSHSASISSQTSYSQNSYSQTSQSYVPAPPSHQPPPPPPLASVTSPTTGKPKPPPKPAKPLLLTGIFGGKRPSISSPTVSQTGSSVGGKILATGLVGATAAVATAFAGQSSASASSKPSNLPPLITNAVTKPSSSSSHHGKTAAIVAGTAALTVAAVASHKKEKEKEKEKQKISTKPSVTSSSSGDVTRIHGLKGKANYNQRSNDIRGVKLPSAMNAFDSASSSDFLFDTDEDSSSSSSSHGKKRRHKGNHEKKKGKNRAIEDLSSSHSSMDFGGDDTGRSRGNSKSYGALGAATTAAITIPGVVNDLNHSEDEGSSPRNRPGSHMRKKSTDSDLAFGRSVGSNVSGYTSDSSMYSSKQSPETGGGFQFWAVRNRTGRRKARRVSSRDSINSVNSALGFGDSSDESKPGSKGWLRKRESLDSNLAFGLSSASTSRRSSYASGLRDKFTIEEEDDDEYERDRRKDNQESPTMVKAALETAAAYTAAEAARRKSHDRRPSEGIIVAPGHRLITEEQRMADYERLDRMRTEELKKDIARQKEAARLSELENDRKEKEKFDRERMERRRKEEEFRREKQWMIEEEERRGSIQRQVTPFYYYY